MITLYAFGPRFGLPDPSPFVTKAELLLKMAGVAYRTDLTGFNKAPKGKLPYIDDEGERIADSTFIRWHLEKKHNANFDRGLTAEQRSIAWAFEKLAEDNLYWTVLESRWMNDANFEKGPRTFFAGVPAPLRPFIVGAEPTGVDATIFALTASVLCRAFDSPLRTAAERHDSLRRYVGRMAARYYPDLGEIAGCKAAA